MRFLNFVQSHFVSCMHQNVGSARTIMNRFRGSWEVWAQIQTALLVVQNEGNFYFDREIQFPNSRQTCDFRIDPYNAEGNYIWVELKVQLQGGSDDLVVRFENDVDKLLRLHDGRFGNNTGGAIAFAPNWGDDFVTALRTAIPVGRRNLYSYYTFSTNVLRRPVLHNLRDAYQPSDSDAVVAYRAVLGEPATKAMEDTNEVGAA